MLPLLVGLTGSIGMGKSTVSGFLSARNVPVLSADEVVHKLYSVGGAAVGPVGAAFPDAVVSRGIDRAQLSKYVVGNEAAMKQLEGIVHPLVEAERLQFIQQVGLPWG
jgi:dephospho-CoA kinase